MKPVHQINSKAATSAVENKTSCMQLLPVRDGTTTTTTVLRPFVRDYPGKPVPEETPTHHPDYHPIFISFFHLP